MTREEAIKILKAIRVYECYPKSASEETKEAIDMAIESLSAKPTDLISRADAVSEIHKYFVEEIDKTPTEIDEDGDEIYTDMPTVNSLLACNKELSKRIKSLPSADRPSGEWIPCETSGMPPEGKSVLMSDGNRIWIDETVAWWGDRSDWIGTAWMPLPTPYKGDDTE